MMNTLPTWVPEAARHYLVHTEAGLSIRQLARDAGCHASTVMRQVRKVENRRDDPLIDGALRALGGGAFGPAADGDARAAALIPAERLEQEALRVLRRLCEPGAMMAAAPGMDKAVVVRETETSTCRTAVVDLDLAQAMALKDWIACHGHGRVARYRITPAGRQELTRLVGKGERLRFEESQAVFEGRAPAPADRGSPIRHARVDSPLVGLARRQDRDGEPFLGPELVAAGERLREDFELAGLDEGATVDWFAIVRGEAAPAPGDVALSGPPAARARAANALRDLGPGLGDVALRCCCRLEGLETAEREMGWSARSGKIVLRIALQRLRQHFEAQRGGPGALIG